MKQTLQLRTSQQLTLTPQLQQSIKLLQLSTLELNQELDRILDENPMLERAEDGEGDELLPLLAASLSSSNSETGDAPAATGDDAITVADDSGAELLWEGTSAGGHDDDDFEPGGQTAAVESLREHLAWQVQLSQLGERDRQLLLWLIEALDDDGYLGQPFDELVEAINAAAAEAGLEGDEGELVIPADELRVALRYLQTLDPPGVGAADLADCLRIQLEQLAPDTPFRDAALLVVNDHLDALASRDVAGLRKRLGCDDDTVRGLHHLITGLNPRPGAAFGETETRYVIPDVRVLRQRDRWVVRLNAEALPRLRINRTYAELLGRNRGNNGELGGRLQEARWMLRNVQQRFETILRVSQAIVARQQAFFDHGEVAMRPLVLREIAEALDLHESTISRVTTQKYMMTPRGLFELKFFFGSHVATESGGAASSTAIRALIRQLVASEDRRQPLSDSQLADILGRQGIMVARRTVAKYRESLQIPAVALRKSL